jgi:hypothetical protein
MRLNALIQLADVRPAALTLQDRDDIERGAREENDLSLRIELCFALGGLLEDDGEIDAAFEAFARGNALKRSAMLWRRPLNNALISSL